MDEEITYGVDTKPTPVINVFLEREVEIGGVAFSEYVHLIEVHRPNRSYVSATWLWKANEAIGKVMPKASKELKRRFAELLKKGDSKSDFRFDRDERRNTVHVSHGPDYLRIAHGDDDF